MPTHMPAYPLTDFAVRQAFIEKTMALKFD